MNENRNLLLAILLSAVVIFGWQYFVAAPQMKTEHAKQAQLAQQEKAQPRHDAKVAAPAISRPVTREAALKNGGKRIVIDTPTVDGSFSLTGARFDDLRLKKYRETVDPKSPEIVLLAPQSTNYPYYAVFGWVAPPGSKTPVPGDDTPWTLKSGDKLTPGHPVTLEWNNGHGLVFTRTIAVDDQYMFTVNDSVKNQGGEAATLYPFAYVARDGLPQSQHYWVVHEGFVGYAGGSAKYTKYDALKPDKPTETFNSTGGWIGITDKYWMATVIPPQSEAFEGSFAISQSNGRTDYQSDYRLDARKIAPGATISVKQQLFAGAKVVKTLRDYETKYGIQGFDYAIDWGWFFFITRPMFLVLDEFYKLVGNFGVAILLLTVAVKLLFFPLADASYRSMSRMKKLQPKVEEIRTRFAEDRVRQQQEMMELYKREKVNPVSGCLPMLIQVPVFFSLYKVLFVTIEMRHAPFFGWIKDLSAHDPTSIINLFGLLPYQVPAFFHDHLTFLSIGIWPILMGVTQFVQTKLNPAPADPIQARMFLFMPLIFTFMLATFPAGLVIYWTWNNLLSILQQIIMMKRTGTPIQIFEDFKSSRAKAAAGE
ncbi:MAG TPA: membrane protein insertase YidC [Rhizomicrobium sp.]|nr:membrane protein insertase YidC [Rhizomicrobium sp.]